MHTALPWWLVFSASQVSVWRECERKWGYRYIVGHKTPQTPAQKLGDDVERKQIQPYLTSGRPFDDNEAGQIAKAMQPHLPAPKTPGMEMQKRIALASPSGKWAYQGYTDLWVKDSRIVPGVKPYDGPPIPGVVDFKTTKSLRWQKTAEVLKTDPQANLYATYALAESEGDFVDLAWITGTTVKPYKGKPSYLRRTIDEVAPQFDAIDVTGAALHDVRMAAVPTMDADADTKLRFVLSLTPNPYQCDEFGGCPHRATCNLAPQKFRDAVVEKLTKQKETRNMSNAASALARLKARKPGGDTTAPTAPQQSAPAPAAPPAATAAPTPPVQAPTPEPPKGPEYTVSDQAAQAAIDRTVAAAEANAFAGINPPEKDLPPAPAVGKAAAAGADDVTNAQQPTSESEAPKAGRGRPRGSKNKKPDPDPTGADIDLHTSNTGDTARAAVRKLVREVAAEVFEEIAASLRGAA